MHRIRGVTGFAPRGKFRHNAPMPTPFARRRASFCALIAAFGFASGALAETRPAKHSFTASAAEAAGKMWSGAQDVAIYALGLIGVDYKFGGNTPQSGLDCSGLVRYVFQEVTGVTLPRTAKEMSGLGAKVSADDLKPGDLVFFNTRRFQYSHVGIYLGDNRFIHAPSAGSEVEIARLSESYWQKHFNGARRLVGVLPSLVPNVISPATASTLSADLMAPLPPTSTAEAPDVERPAVTP
jgi:cell wall-associated NlpC family hydrolase